MSDIFIGPNKVTGNESVSKLPTGETVFKLQYETGGEEFFTQRMFEALIKGSPTDLTTLRDDRVFAIIPRVLELFLNWGVKLSEVNYLIDRIVQSINQNQAAADNKVWGKNRLDVSFIDLDKVLRVPAEPPKSVEPPTNVTLNDILPQPPAQPENPPEG